MHGRLQITATVWRWILLSQMSSAPVLLKNTWPLCMSDESVLGTWPLKTMRYLPKGRRRLIISGEAMHISPCSGRSAQSITRTTTPQEPFKWLNRIIMMQSISHLPVFDPFSERSRPFRQYNNSPPPLWQTPTTNTPFTACRNVQHLLVLIEHDVDEGRCR